MSYELLIDCLRSRSVVATSREAYGAIADMAQGGVLALTGIGTPEQEAFLIDIRDAAVVIWESTKDD